MLHATSTDCLFRFLLDGGSPGDESSAEPDPDRVFASVMRVSCIAKCSNHCQCAVLDAMRLLAGETEVCWVSGRDSAPLAAFSRLIRSHLRAGTVILPEDAFL